jgi:HlyD family secretion protein
VTWVKILISRHFAKPPPRGIISGVVVMSHLMDEAVERRWWRSRRLVLVAGVSIVAALVALLAIGWFGDGGSTLRVARGGVVIETARRGIFHDLTTLEGSIVPHDTIYLDALEGGQVKRVLARAGDQVREGQPLVEFRNTQLELDILSQEGRLIESMTQLQARQQQLEQAEADNHKTLTGIDYQVLRLTTAVSRRQALAARGFVTGEEFDRLRDELAYNVKLRPIQARTTAAQSALRSEQQPQIRAELATLRKSLSITRSKLDELTVRAPVGGRLTVMDLKIGQTRNRGDRLGEITLDTGSKVEADVDEFYLDRVRLGQTAEVTLHGRPATVRVSRIYPTIKNGRFTIELEFLGPAAPDVLPGEAVRGRLSLGQDRPAIVLPAGAFLEQTGGNWLFVLAADGRSASRRVVRPGRRNADQIEVLAGLAPGDRVITSSYRGWEKIEHITLTE